MRQPAVLRGPHRPDLLRSETLPGILAATVARRPHHPALIWGDRIVTYAELASASRHLGAALRARGSGAGQIAGLWLPRGADLLIAQAGITESGAAWLPFDAQVPLERMRICLKAAQVMGVVTTREWLPRLKEISVPAWACEDLLAEAIGPTASPAASPDDPAYVIYTSGSTGQPKGIVISHRGICHFLRSENALLDVRPDDRVYQGFSVAFDMSFEEIWISYLVGATLWIAPASVTTDPDLLAASLSRQEITVLHAVPTLMALVDHPLPTLRLLNLGGEACPDAIAQRLIKPGRRVCNTYGPTETSVSATLAELRPGESVSIGYPLPNYGLLIVDPEGRPRPFGEVGELAIFGPGLATGYLGMPELTANRFVPNPVAATPQEARMYLTGDLARIEPGGPVRCLGRTDSQVKIRGFRVELDEIAAALGEQPGVAAASVVLRKIDDMDALVGFVIPSVGFPPEPARWRQALAARLPSYMVPDHLEAVTELPRLPSGKINLEALRAQPLREVESMEDRSALPRNPEEAALFTALAHLFPGRSFRPEMDFFDDLGGHSLLVARLVSRLRGNARYASLSVQDVYRERRLAGMASAMARLQQQPSASTPRRAALPAWRRWLCGLSQAAVLPCFVLLQIADWLAPFFVYHYCTGEPGDSVARAVGWSLLTFVLARLANFAIAILGKRCLAGRLSAGRYPLWGVTYFRWWLANRFAGLPDAYLLAGTPWMAGYLRALGARIGRDVMIDTITLGVPELLTIEDGASLGTFVNIENARVEAGWLILGPVRCGRDAVVESYAVLENDTGLGERACLRGQSALAAGRSVPAGETWEGAPARRIDHPAEPLPPRPQIPTGWRWARAAWFALTAVAASVLFFLPTFPAFMLIDWVDAHTWDIFESSLNPLAAFGLFFVLAIPASALFVGATMLLTAALRWLMPRQSTGLASVYGLAYWRKKCMSLILDSSLHELHGLYASIYAPFWLRCLGVRVGRHAEVSTAEGLVPELLTLGDDCFVADGVLLGDEEQRGGWMILKPTQIGNRSFLGNGAYVPDGTVVPDDVLIGVQTSAPANAQLRPGQTWMGSPPLLLPARECLQGFPASLTFRPSMARRIGRGCVEALRILLPLAVIIAAGYLIIVMVVPLAEAGASVMTLAAALSLAGCLYGLASLLLVVALKWLLVGRYRPRAAPMWIPFVWLSEAVTNLYESLAVPNLLDHLRGTPMLPWALRLFGVRIGRGVYMNTTDLTEFDCVGIGDEAELNAWCGPQTHLFEDRVMKIGNVDIGAQVTVGSRATILYDTRVGDRVCLGPLTLVAKGECLPADTRWEGSPATPSSGA